MSTDVAPETGSDWGTFLPGRKGDVIVQLEQNLDAAGVPIPINAWMEGAAFRNQRGSPQDIQLEGLQFRYSGLSIRLLAGKTLSARGRKDFRTSALSDGSSSAEPFRLRCGTDADFVLSIFFIAADPSTLHIARPPNQDTPEAATTS